MEDSSSSFGLNKAKLRRLLKMGLKRPEVKSTDAEQKKARLWRNLLSKPFPKDSDQLDVLPDILADFCQTLGLVAGDKLGEYLRNPKADLSVIDNIKKYAKVLSRDSRSDDEHIIANTLYYAAIAHALLYHQRKITEFSYTELKKAFDKLRRIMWIEKHFTQLFVKAYELSKNEQH